MGYSFSVADSVESSHPIGTKCFCWAVRKIADSAGQSLDNPAVDSLPFFAGSLTKVVATEAAGMQIRANKCANSKGSNRRGR